MLHIIDSNIKGIASINQLLWKGLLPELTTAIDQYIMEEGNEALVQVNQFLSEPLRLSVLIHHILDQEEAFLKVITESYYHENGFHKIVLLTGAHFKLRLHHFGAAARIPMENVHDHRWAFASSILRGSLKMDLLEVGAEQGEPVLHYLYDSNKETGKYGLQLLGTTQVSVKEKRSYAAGTQYLMLPHELHRITNQEGEESITLILTGRPDKKTCNLYAKREILEAEQGTIPYQWDEMIHMLITLSDKIFPVLN